MAMPNKPSSLSSQIITRTLVWGIIVGYGVFLVGRSTYQNYRVNRDIDDYREKIALLEKSQAILHLSLIYYRSASFKEAEARWRLNLKGKDERVVALPLATTVPSLNIALPVAVNTREAKIKPSAAWWQLLFGSKNQAQ
jgi:hypothetical protein